MEREWFRTFIFLPFSMFMSPIIGLAGSSTSRAGWEGIFRAAVVAVLRTTGSG
jgi:hypothetical protein